MAEPAKPAAAPQVDPAGDSRTAEFSQRGQGAARRRVRTPRSALSSGWCGSGRTISASRPTRCRQHGRRLRARGDPAACARPLRRHAARGRKPSGDAVLSRQLRARSARTRSPASTAAAGSTRTSRARSSSCIRSACARGYTQDDVTSFAKVLTGWTIIPAGRQSRARRRVRVQSRACTSRARRRCSARPIQTGGVEQGRAVLADLARASGDGEAHRDQARAPFRRRRAAAGAGRARSPRRFRDTDGDLKEVAKALVDRAGGLGRAAQQAQAPERMAHRRLSCAPDSAARRIRARVATQALLGEPLWRPPAPQGLFRRRGGLDRRPGAAARHRQHVCASRVGGRASTRSASRRRARPAGVGRNAASRRARREPRSRRWRCC